MIVAGPAVTSPGQTNATPVHVVDLFSTILDLAGTSTATTVPPDLVIDSRSFISTLSGTTDMSRQIYTETFSPTPKPQDGRALRDDRYKLIRFADGHEEFYLLESDPYESTNLLAVGLNPEQQQYHDRLSFWYASYSTNTGPAIVEPTWNDGQFSLSVTQSAGAAYTLWRCDELANRFWSPLTNAVQVTNGNTLKFTDEAPLEGRAFYTVTRE
jgi:hypothetical protein